LPSRSGGGHGFVLLINVLLPRLGWLIYKYAPDNHLVERFYVIELKCEGA